MDSERDDDDDKMEIRPESIASDDAVFVYDLVEQGCSFHLASGRLFLCRRNGGKWENALIYQMTNFPDREVVEDVSCSMATVLWVEPHMWNQLDLAPNQSVEAGLGIFQTMASSGRFKLKMPSYTNEELKAKNAEEDRLWDLLVERCRGKTHRQVIESEEGDA